MDYTLTINYFQRYRWVTIPSLVLLLAGIFFFVLLLLQKTHDYTLNNINRNAAEANGRSNSGSSGKPLVNYSGSEYTIDPSNLQGLISKTDLPNGMTKYFLKSTESTKSDIIIAKGSDFIFRKAVFTTDYQPSIDSFVNLYGTPDKITKGSKTYGPGAMKYIYSSLGFTIFVDPQTKLVVEQDIYPPMTVDQYIVKYGNEDQ